MSPEQYNKLRGRALSAMLMELIKTSAATKEELTMRQLSLRLADQEQLQNEELRKHLYYRVRTTLRQLENAGMVKVTTLFHPVLRVNCNIISLP
jgi:hypothetical protein